MKILNLSFVLKCLVLGFVSLSWIVRSEDLDEEFEPLFPLEEEKDDANDVNPRTDQKQWLLPVVMFSSGVVIVASGFVHSFLKFRERLASSRFQPFQVVDGDRKETFGSKAFLRMQNLDNKGVDPFWSIDDHSDLQILTDKSFRFLVLKAFDHINVVEPIFLSPPFSIWTDSFQRYIVVKLTDNVKRDVLNRPAPILFLIPTAMFMNESHVPDPKKAISYMKVFCNRLNKYGGLKSDSSDDGTIYMDLDCWDKIEKILDDFLPKLQGDIRFDFELFWRYYQRIMTPAFEAALKSIFFWVR